MANRFNPGNNRYLDANGDPLSGGKLRFKATGSDTLKDTYSDSALSSANANPVVLDANGQHSDIFLDGVYKVELLTSADVELWEKDPVGDDSASGQFLDWSAATTYATSDIAKGSDGNFYLSITSSNSGNDPTSSATNWTLLEFLKTWNTNETYDDGVVVKGSDDYIYRSKAGSNSGNDPTSDTTNWGFTQPGIPHAAGRVNSSGTLLASFNVSSCSKTSTGFYDITLSNAVTSASTALGVSNAVGQFANNFGAVVYFLDTTSFQVVMMANATGTATDREFTFVVWDFG